MAEVPTPIWPSYVATYLLTVLDAGPMLSHDGHSMCLTLAIQELSPLPSLRSRILALSHVLHGSSLIALATVHHVSRVSLMCLSIISSSHSHRHPPCPCPPWHTPPPVSSLVSLQQDIGLYDSLRSTLAIGGVRANRD
jgi:hypothetical protein